MKTKCMNVRVVWMSKEKAMIQYELNAIVMGLECVGSLLRERQPCSSYAADTQRKDIAVVKHSVGFGRHLHLQHLQGNVSLSRKGVGLS